MDVCHSAAASPGEKGLIRVAASTGSSAAKPDLFALGTGQALLCSSLADQVSWESKEYTNSVFTKRLMESLQFKGDKTTLTEAYYNLKDAVESEVLRDRGEVQTPVLNSKLWTGGDPVLAVTPAKPHSTMPSTSQR